MENNWSSFERAAKGKYVIIYGVGPCVNIFFERYGCTRTPDAVIDNNEKKQGQKVKNIVPAAWCLPMIDTVVSSSKILDSYDADKTVILIGSAKRYGEIAEEIQKRGFENYFILTLFEDFDQNTMNEKMQQYIRNYVSECCKLPICKKKIVFFSFARYADHGKYISERLLEMRTDIDVVWALNDMDDILPERARKVALSNMREFIYEMETAEIWIYNTLTPDYIVKRKEQIFIETKHWSSITLKRFFLDSSTITDVESDVNYWEKACSYIDYIITGSDFDTQSCRRGFHFNKDVVQIGSPRSDALFHPEINKEKVSSYYNLKAGVKIALYAPTYRYSKAEKELHIPETRAIDLDYEKLLDALKGKYDNEWVIMLRLHPGHEKDVRKLKLPDYVIDVSPYADVQELISACNIMLTDYSSIMFEPAYVYKPVFLFATDREDYIDKEYDLLIDYDTLPFPIVESNDELCDVVKNFNQREYDRKLKDFFEEYGIHEDGHASERAAEFVSSLIDERNKLC